MNQFKRFAFIILVICVVLYHTDMMYHNRWYQHEGSV